MNSKDLKKMAALGIAGGLLFSGQGFAGTPDHSIDLNQLLAGHGCGGKNGCGGSGNGNGNGNGNYQRYILKHNDYLGREVAIADENTQEITEQELYRSLSAPSKAIYEALPPEGRTLALKYANELGDNEAAVQKAKEEIASQQTDKANRGTSR